MVDNEVAKDEEEVVNEVEPWEEDAEEIDVVVVEESEVEVVEVVVG